MTNELLACREAKSLPDFGDYVVIEQKRYSGPNVFFTYKVVGNLQSNTYRSVPVETHKTELQRGEIVPIINAICCGIMEDKVERFRVQDLHSVNTRPAADDGVLLAALRLVVQGFEREWDISDVDDDYIKDEMGTALSIAYLAARQAIANAETSNETP